LTIAGVDIAPRTIQVASGTKAIGNPTWIGDTVLVPLLFFGQHRGFAPPRPDRDFNPNAPFNAVRPERSLETEAGVRARLPERGSVQAVLYDLKLDDLIVEGPLVGGRSGSFVNAGRAVHRGLELSGEWRRGGVGFAAAYSWLYEATLRSDVDLGASGVRGKRVPYAPVHQFDIAMDVGLGRDLFLEVGVNFLDEQFATADNVRAGSADGMSGLIPARRLWRATLRHEPAGSALRLHLSAQNLFDSKYVASRVDGLFAGMPRLVTAGVEYRF
jgi:Fe(3+) dicitrate transport protein